MIVLGIDTTGTTSSAAVVTVSEVSVAVSRLPRGHAAVLPGLIEQACRQAHLLLPDITAVAVARGPGMFTGMRVGLVAGQMLALARGLPVVGVSTLHAAAHRVVLQHQPAGTFVVMLDARRREVFAQTFDAAARPLDEPRPLSAAALHPAGEVFRDEGAAALGVAGRDLDTVGLAAEVAQLASGRWVDGEPQEPATALYLRRPDTTAANPARSVLGST